MLQCPNLQVRGGGVEPGIGEHCGFDCKTHGQFRVAGTVIALMEAATIGPSGDGRTRSKWPSGPPRRASSR
jgi:hypothetical protein